MWENNEKKEKERNWTFRCVLAVCWTDVFVTVFEEAEEMLVVVRKTNAKTRTVRGRGTDWRRGRVRRRREASE